MSVNCASSALHRAGAEFRSAHPPSIVNSALAAALAATCLIFLASGHAQATSASVPIAHDDALAGHSQQHSATPGIVVVIPPKRPHLESSPLVKAKTNARQQEDSQSAELKTPLYATFVQPFGAGAAPDEQSALPLLTEIVGIASMYNPYKPGYEPGDSETASGETYDPEAWTAAIQSSLRGRFGGVHYGRNYRPAYALVSDGERQLIVKINDVGPLLPGRVIDLNERAMRYFDPSLQRGLVQNVSVTPLPGEDWTPGPLESEQRISFADQSID